MDTIKLLFTRLKGLARQVVSLPTVFKTRASRRRERKAADEQEAERIDRIRNPSKYLGETQNEVQ